MTHSAKTLAMDPMAACKWANIAFLVAAAYLLVIYPALATDTPMGIVLCNIVDFIYGNMGRGLATIAIIVVGVGATLGKVSWGLAITVAVGISVIFNAPTIADALLAGTGGSGAC